MTARATDEPHCASSELELLFDLTFVVAISRITPQLVDSIANAEEFTFTQPGSQELAVAWVLRLVFAAAEALPQTSLLPSAYSFRSCRSQRKPPEWLSR
jgi:hypothetical protein